MHSAIKQKEVFVIPYWIKNILDRNKLPLTTVIDAVALKSLTSSEDMALMLLLNQNTVPFFGEQKPLEGIFWKWTSTPEAISVFEQLQDLRELHKGGLEERLFSEKNFDPNYPVPFEIKDADPETFLIVIYPGFFGGPEASKYQTQLVAEYLKLWYGYSDYDSMARDVLFGHYLKQL